MRLKIGVSPVRIIRPGFFGTLKVEFDTAVGEFDTLVKSNLANRKSYFISSYEFFPTLLCYHVNAIAGKRGAKKGYRHYHKIIINMIIRISSVVALLLLFSSHLIAQTYESDSLKIEIRYKNDLLVKEYKDMDMEIVYLCKSKSRKIFVYDDLDNFYRSTFGNCYFELHKYDAAYGGYKNITFEVMGNKHPPKDFKNSEEILRYDLKRSPLIFGAKRVLTFNLLRFTPILANGKYTMKFYLRVANNYGYDPKGQVIANSISYVETPVINFEILNTIHTPFRL